MTDILEGTTPGRLTAEYLAMTPLQKWETLTLNGLLGTNEPWIEDMRQHLARKAASADKLVEALDAIRNIEKTVDPVALRGARAKEIAEQAIAEYEGQP